MPIPTQNALRLRKLTQHIGAEVTGIDLAKPVDARTRAWLNDALAQNVVLVIKDQTLDAHQFLAAGSLFGEPMARHYSTPLAEAPLVHRISSHARNKDGSVRLTGPLWHTDQADDECPPKYTALYAIELFRTGGGTTGFINMRAVYEALPESLKQRIAPLKGVYLPRGARKYADADGVVPRSAEAREPVIHPLVRTNPDTGRKAVYFHPQHIKGIVGMAPDAASALLSDLLKRALQPDYHYKHDWTLGDMLIWDNRAALHRANNDYDPTDMTQHRCMLRMLVEGERPR